MANIDPKLEITAGNIVKINASKNWGEYKAEEATPFNLKRGEKRLTIHVPERRDASETERIIYDSCGNPLFLTWTGDKDFTLTDVGGNPVAFETAGDKTVALYAYEPPFEERLKEPMPLYLDDGSKGKGGDDSDDDDERKPINRGGGNNADDDEEDVDIVDSDEEENEKKNKEEEEEEGGKGGAKDDDKEDIDGTSDSDSDSGSDNESDSGSDDSDSGSDDDSDSSDGDDSGSEEEEEIVIGKRG